MRLIFVYASIALLVACSSQDQEQEVRQVFIDNGAVQCQFSGKPPAETATLLTDGGVEVIESQCAVLTGMAVAAMCGMGDLNIHVHTIDANDVSKAETLGFRSVGALAQGEEAGWLPTDCPE